MKFSELDLRPSPRKLRQFSWIWCGVFVVLAGWHSRQGPTPWTMGLAGAGVIGGLLGTIAPRTMQPAYLGLTLIGYPIGLVVNWTALLLLYYAVFTPIAVVFRVTGRDVLHRRIQPGWPSYWVRHEGSGSPKRYLRQF